MIFCVGGEEESQVNKYVIDIIYTEIVSFGHLMGV